MPAPAATDPTSARTLAQLLALRIAATPQAEAYRQFDETAGDWASTSWRAFGERVERFAAAMLAGGLARGARVAVLLPNGLDAVSVDQAALALACVPVPMHAIDNPASIAYILADSEAELLVADHDAQFQAIAATGALPPTLRQVVLVRRDPGAPSTLGGVPVLSLAEWLQRGAGSRAAVPERTGPGAEDEDSVE